MAYLLPHVRHGGGRFHQSVGLDKSQAFWQRTWSCCVLRRSVGRQYAKGLRDVGELVPMRDKTCETLPSFM